MLIQILAVGVVISIVIIVIYSIKSNPPEINPGTCPFCNKRDNISAGPGRRYCSYCKIHFVESCWKEQKK
ncbi:MAG: hypothetical protein LBC39_04230 [Methanobrevibacter sp.]|nr:hypothetical protein [Candidatus Methanovirga aequatorialis]